MGGWGSRGGLRGRKRDLWEGGHRVPGIIRYPRAVQQNVKVWQTPTSTWDFASTMLDAMGVQDTAFRDGESLMPLLSSATPQSWRRTKPLGFCSVRQGDIADPKTGTSCTSVAWLVGDVKLMATRSNSGRIVAKGFYNVSNSEFQELSVDSATRRRMMSDVFNWANSVVQEAKALWCVF